MRRSNRSHWARLCQISYCSPVHQKPSASLRLCAERRRLNRVRLSSSLESVPKFTVQEWIVVLRLATMWEMEGLRAFAIDALETHFKSSGEHAASQVRAGLDHRVDGWASAGTRSLVCQADPMSTGDITMLEPAIVAMILKHRQQAVQRERESVLHQARKTQHCHVHKNGGFAASCSYCVPSTMIRVGTLDLIPEEQEGFDQEAGPIIQQLTKM
jgi:hypothetical protein